MASAGEHRLQPLFNPRSIAVVGASGREGRPGFETVKAARLQGWDGALYPVTPRYEEIFGTPCIPGIADLPETVDLAIIAGSVARMEADATAALEAGARALIVYGTPEVHEDPGFPERFRGMLKEAGVPVLGPNSIGYVNYATGAVGTWVPPTAQPAGNVASVIQSGSLYSCSTLTDPRIGFAFTAHPAQEVDVTVAEIADYALDLPGTEVLAFYVEIIRDPEGFMAMLSKAEAKGVPVVILKPGRSEGARAAIATHTGRLAAGDAVIDAVLRKHNAHRVDSLDEWWTTIALFAQIRDIGPGALAVMTDSGGQKALTVDEAQALGVPLAEFSEETRAALRARLAPDLAPENPIDYWGGEEKLVEHVEALLKVAAADQATAIAMVMTEAGVVETDPFMNDTAEAVIRGAPAAEKPVAVGTFSARQLAPARTMRMVKAGVPVLDGTPMALRAIRHLFRWRDRQVQVAEAESRLPDAIDGTVLSARSGREADALALLDACGIATIATHQCSDEATLEAACADLSFPIAMKTAEGHAHKADVGGVVLGIEDTASALAAYRDVSARLGPAVTLQEMAPGGVEVALGMVNDEDYGPLIMAASGGTLVELLDDKIFVQAPVTGHEAREMVAALKCAPLLKGYRGSAPADTDALVAAIQALSALALQCRDQIAAIDINPLIVHPGGAVAVDALIEFSG